MPFFMSDELTVQTIIDTIQARPPDFHSNAVKDCTLNSPSLIFQFLQNQIQSLNSVKSSSESFLSDSNHFSDCLSLLSKSFEFNIDFDGILYVVSKGETKLGYFKVDEGDECWFEMGESINGLPFGTVTIDNGLMTWHEIGHCIHHIMVDLDTVPPDLWELGGVLFEQFASEFYGVELDEDHQRKDLAIALVDLELSLCSSITEQELIGLIEHVQNYVGVDLVMGDLYGCIMGMYGGVYFTYPWCRHLVTTNRENALNLVGISGDF